MKKILLTGHISYNLMSPFYRNLKTQLPDCQISVLGLNRPGKGLTESDKQEFDEVLEKPKINKALVKKKIYRLGWMFRIGGKGWKSILKSGAQLKPKEAYSVVYGYIHNNMQDDAMKQIFSNFDIINIHYLSAGNLKQINWLSDKNKLMLSFWGSDLFQENGPRTYKVQYNAFRKADAITLHTHDMSQIFLSKFGHGLRGKVHRAIFGCPVKRFDLIDGARTNTNAQEDFLKKNQISTDKIIVQLGYSGGPGHQHIKVLQTLERLPEVIKTKLVIMIPTTYNNSNTAYYEQLKKTIQSSSLTIRHITDYMSDEEVLIMPVVSDVFIHVRDADALNNSMMESLYSGSLLITGAWLPYKKLTNQNVTFEQIEELKEVVSILQNYVENKTKYESKLKENKQILRQSFTMEGNIKYWKKAYESIL